MDCMVTLKHGSKEWKTRSTILCTCSSVLNTILLDSDPEELKEMHLDDVHEENVDAFLTLASSTSHDKDSRFPTVQELAAMTCHAMPLVHKYDCNGLLKMLQSAQNQHPNVDGIMAILEHEPDAVEWLGVKAQNALTAHLFQTHRSDKRFERQVCVDKMASMSPALLRLLFVHTMLDDNPHIPSDWGRKTLRTLAHK
eukprot:6923321-Prymnesium_polylepis.1